jgi:outer membrane protein assembly factor BamB
MRAGLLCCFLSFSVAVSSVCGQQTSPANLVGLHGGLVVQLGAGELVAATEMSVTGRYLVHVLDRRPGVVRAAQLQLQQKGHYGLVWAEKTTNAERLPYAENMVNLVIVQDYTVPVAELHRGLVPGGAVVANPALLMLPAALQAGGFTIEAATDSWIVARKPWPENMDDWSHPRHAADGNAVSNDTAVGPPDRVRWIAAATSEVEGMVSAGGRNFYGGVLARDSFNGLRLWHRRLAKKEDNNPMDFSLPRLARDGIRPVASQQSLFAMLGDRLMALDAKTGESQVEFGDMVSPKSALHDGSRVIAADRDSIRAFSTETGKELWKLAVPDPRHIVGDGAIVTFIKGRKRGDKAEAVAVDARTGEIKWQRHDHPWLASVVRTVLSNGMLAYEISSLNDHDAGNAIHIVSAATGEHSWSKAFPPGMNHRRQARAMFLNNDIWILHGGKINTGDKATLERMPTQVSALNPQTGKTRVTYPAGMAHCFPPVATQNYMFAGVLNLTDLSSGKVIANRITKANCSSENGWVPANGLVYTTPKHCTCWPMLRGFVAMAPAIKGESVANRPLEEIAFQLEKGPASADSKAANPQASDWPQYRHDKWRSGSSTAAGPNQLKQVWSVSLEGAARSQRTGAVLHDWQENPVVKGPLSAPTVANGLAYVTRPDAHEVVAVGTKNGEIRWRFTANGRVDTPPTIHRGLCLFGTAAGWVYALRADSGQVVWRLRAAPTNQRIVAYGQVESPWPVPGSVLVMDGVAYFAAGRQPLADGGIIVFAVNPLTGERHWVKRINTVPQKGFYENSGLEFDPTDLLHAEGDGLAMSRWVLTRDGKDVTVDKWSGFAKLSAGTGAVWIPRGSWTYGARHQHRFAGEASRRPLVVFRDKSAFSSLNGSTELFRRRFDLANGETFNSKWITGWAAAQASRKNEKPYRTYRLAEGAEWSVDPFTTPSPEAKERRGAQQYNRLHAITLDGDGKLFVAHQDGRLKVISTADGSTLTEASIPTPAWDGLAIADKRLFLSTQDGRLICYGEH